MVQARGKTREFIQELIEIEVLIQKAEGAIDTKEQFTIRANLEKAIEKCRAIRNQYDPL